MRPPQDQYRRYTHALQIGILTSSKGTPTAVYASSPSAAVRDLEDRDTSKTVYRFRAVGRSLEAPLPLAPADVQNI